MVTGQRIAQKLPKIFAATYSSIAEEARGVVQAHVAELVHQVTQIVASGVAGGEFQVSDPPQAAKAVFSAMI